MNQAARKAYEQSNATSEWSLRCLLAAFAHLGIPRSMLDMGCGAGHLVDFAARIGVESVGVDLFAQTERNLHGGVILKADICKPFDMRREFELVLCWEVAEHIPATHEVRLLEELYVHLETGGTLLFTAAHPGQGGSGHVNEQPSKYWRSRLGQRRLVYHDAKTKSIRSTWQDVCGPAWWYPQNLLVFVK